MCRMSRCASWMRGGDGHVALVAERLDLAAEDLLERAVVGDGRQRRRVGGQGDGGNGLAFYHEPVDELRREMLGLGRAPAVAAGQDLVPLLHGMDNGLHGLLEASAPPLLEPLP